MSKGRKAILLFGPPGSGKGTQANLLAEKLGVYHFDTGRYLEHYVYNSAEETEEVKEAKRAFETGQLISPEFVLKVLSEKIIELHSYGASLVFSGSPRTMFEAEQIIPQLIELYGKENLYAFVIKVPEEVSIKRNSNRLMCSACGAPLLLDYYNGDPKNCPLCGGELYKRSLDKAEVIVERLKTYHERTEPILNFVKEIGLGLVEVDGTPAPYKVFKTIHDHIKNS